MADSDKDPPVPGEPSELETAGDAAVGEVLRDDEGEGEGWQVPEELQEVNSLPQPAPKKSMPPPLPKSHRPTPPSDEHESLSPPADVPGLDLDWGPGGQPRNGGTSTTAGAQQRTQRALSSKKREVNSRGRLLLLGAIVLGLFIFSMLITWAIFALRTPSRGAHAQTSAVTAPASNDVVAEVAPAAAGDVSVELLEVPPMTEIRVDGRFVDSNPFTVVRGIKHVVELRAAEFFPKQFEFTADNDLKVKAPKLEPRSQVAGNGRPLLH